MSSQIISLAPLISSSFVKKLIYYVPILDQADLDDINNVVTYKRPLAFCASLVASMFVPGGASVRTMLIPHVVEFLESLEGIHRLYTRVSFALISL